MSNPITWKDGPPAHPDPSEADMMSGEHDPRVKPERFDTPIHVRAPRSLVDEMNAAANSLGVKPAEFVRWCIREGIRRAEGWPTPRSAKSGESAEG